MQCQIVHRHATPIQINRIASRESFSAPPPPSPPPFLTEPLSDYFPDKKEKRIIGPHFGVVAVSVPRVPSPGRYHTAELGVLEPVHVLILGEGARGPGLSAWLPWPVV